MNYSHRSCSDGLDAVSCVGEYDPDESIMLRKILKWSFASGLIGIAAVALAFVYFHTKDYSGYFAERRGILVDMQLTAAGEDSVYQKSWLTLVSNSGLRTECGLLVPRETGKRYPAIVLLGGKATGKYAIDYAIGISNVIIAAPDYPYEPREKYTVPGFIADVPEMRTALMDMVPSVMLLTDYLFTREDVDTTRIVLLGYSFGAPLVPPIFVNDRRAAVAALVYGGGDLHTLIRHNVGRYEGPVVSEFVAQLGALLLRPLEPLRYIGHVSPTPLLMINGTHDEQIPRANTEQLFQAAKEPKNIIWLESQHVHPRNEELTRQIITLLESELMKLEVLASPES